MLTVYFTNLYSKSIAEYLAVTPKDHQKMWAESRTSDNGIITFRQQHDLYFCACVMTAILPERSRHSFLANTYRQLNDGSSVTLLEDLQRVMCDVETHTSMVTIKLKFMNCFDFVIFNRHD